MKIWRVVTIFFKKNIYITARTLNQGGTLMIENFCNIGDNGRKCAEHCKNKCKVKYGVCAPNTAQGNDACYCSK